MLRTMRFLWRNFASVFLLLVGYMAIMMVYAALGGGQEGHKTAAEGELIPS